VELSRVGRCDRGFTPVYDACGPATCAASRRNERRRRRRWSARQRACIDSKNRRSSIVTSRIQSEIMPRWVGSPNGFESCHVIFLSIYIDGDDPRMRDPISQATSLRPPTDSGRIISDDDKPAPGWIRVAPRYQLVHAFGARVPCRGDPYYNAVSDC